MSQLLKSVEIACKRKVTASTVNLQRAADEAAEVVCTHSHALTHWEASVTDELLVQLGPFDLHGDHRLVQGQTLIVRLDLVEDLTAHIVPGFLLRVSQRSTFV